MTVGHHDLAGAAALKRRMATLIGLSAIVMWSSLISSILPPLLKKIRVDPALVSAPLIATIVDGTGLIIYFMIAHATLSQLQGL